MKTMKIKFPASGPVMLEIDGVAKQAPSRNAITETALSTGHSPVYVAYRVFSCVMSDDDAYRLAYQVGPALFPERLVVPLEIDIPAALERMTTMFVVTKARRVNLANPAQRAAGLGVTVEQFLHLDGLTSAIADDLFTTVRNVVTGNVLPESLMPADKVESALLYLHDHPDQIPADPHPYLVRMLTRMSVEEQWTAKSIQN